MTDIFDEMVEEEEKQVQEVGPRSCPTGGSPASACTS